MIDERLQLEKELENLVDDMPTKALQILVEYARKVKDVYTKRESNDRQ